MHRGRPSIRERVSSKDPLTLVGKERGASLKIESDETVKGIVKREGKCYLRRRVYVDALTGEQHNKIEKQTGAFLGFPGRLVDGDRDWVEISADKESKVTKASREIDKILKKNSHFAAIDCDMSLSEEWKKLVDYIKALDSFPDMGIRTPISMHITMSVLSIPSPSDAKKAQRALEFVWPKECPGPMVFLGLHVLKGTHKATQVIVSKLDPEDAMTPEWQKLANKSKEALIKAGLKVEEESNPRVNMHLTVYKTRHLKGKIQY